MQSRLCRRVLLLSILSLIFQISSPSAAIGTVWAPATPYRPALRDEQNLNGTWNFTPAGGTQTTIAVPEFWDAQPGFAVGQAVYQKDITIPASWSGKRVFIGFEGVN